MLSQIDQVQDMWGDYSKGQEEGTHHQIQRLPEVDRDDSNRQLFDLSLSTKKHKGDVLRFLLFMTVLLEVTTLFLQYLLVISVAFFAPFYFALF